MEVVPDGLKRVAKPTAKPGEGKLKMLKMIEKAGGFSFFVRERRPKASRKWKQYLSNSRSNTDLWKDFLTIWSSSSLNNQDRGGLEKLTEDNVSTN